MKDLKSFLKTTDRYVNLLNEKGIKTPKDFFYYFPRDYEDRTKIKNIWELTEWIKEVFKANIVDKTIINTQRWKRIIEFKLEDENKNIAYANFMNNNFVLRQLKVWNTVLLSWKPKFSYWKYVIWFPEIISDNFGSSNNNSANLVWNIVPIYSDYLGIKASWFQKKMSEKINDIDNLFNEYLPSYLLKKYDLLDIKTALKNIHFPKNTSFLQKAKYRFNFEQLLIWQIISNYNFLTKKQWEKTEPDWNIVKEFLKKLPFELTFAQKKAIKLIIEDIHSWKLMARLLQWDVWSWKTIVSAIVAYYVIKKFNKQVVLLAPTEVLAAQHIKNISKYFLPEWIKIELLTWSTKKKDKLKEEIKNWNLSLIVWTHAVIQDDVIFKDLWLLIVDEQHKFWVNQRTKLTSQWQVHVLQMTATPIPRSLALSYFWEFENTVIDELPPWRQKITTKVISESEYKKLPQFFINKINQWQQIYIVVPLIEESEKMENLNSAFEEYENVKNMFEATNIKIWLMHWRLKSDEKEKVMKDFKEWKTQILVSTTVIEVWVDVPQATIMVIKNAERFGLSSLHQLRWRVGRWKGKSYCFLVTKSKSWDSYRRLKYMEEFDSWFKLAEIDLKLRWAWTMLWTLQSWEMDLPQEALTDLELIENTRNEAKFILENWVLEKNKDFKNLVEDRINLKNLLW